MSQAPDKYALLEQIKAALDQVERMIQAERETVRRVEAEMRESDAILERELQRMIEEHNARRVGISATISDVMSRVRVGHAADQYQTPPPARDIPDMPMPRVLSQHNAQRR